MNWYWFRFARRLPVTIHLDQDRRFDWICIVGVQIGSWFIGAIQGQETRGKEMGPVGVCRIDE